MTKHEREQARIIRAHYDLSRPVTLEEVRAEIASLRRKHGDYCDMDGRLAAALQCAGVDLQNTSAEIRAHRNR